MEVLRRIRRCQYGECTNDSKNKSITLHRFPAATKQPLYFETWIKNCGLESFKLKFQSNSSNRYICSKHFVGGKGPTKVNPHPTKLKGKVILLNGQQIVIDQDTSYGQDDKTLSYRNNNCTNGNNKEIDAVHSINEKVNPKCDHPYATNKASIGNENHSKHRAPLENEETSKKLRKNIESSCHDNEENSVSLSVDNTVFNETENAESTCSTLGNSESLIFNHSKSSSCTTNDNVASINNNICGREVLRTVRRCQYGECTNDSKNKSVTLHRFPIATIQPIYFDKWIKNCGLESFKLEFQTSSSNKYICSRHFVGDKGPTKVNPHPTELNGKVILLNGQRIVIYQDITRNDNYTTGNKPKEETSSFHNEEESSESLSFDEILFNKTENDDFSTLGNSESLISNTFHSSSCTTNDNLQSLEVKPSPNIAVVLPGSNAWSGETLNQIHVKCESSVIEPSCLFSNLRQSTGCPLNWMTYYGKDEAIYSVVKENSLVLSFRVKRDMSTSLMVLGKTISEHPVLHEISSKINCVGDILQSLKNLEKLCVCVGNAKCDFEIVESKPGKGAYCNLTNAFHSQNCDVLFEKIGQTSRCLKCRCYRKVLNKYKWRMSQNITRKKFALFPKEDLISTIKSGKLRERYFMKQTLVLREKIRKIKATKSGEITKTDSEIDNEEDFSNYIK